MGQERFVKLYKVCRGHVAIDVDVRTMSQLHTSQIASRLRGCLGNPRAPQVRRFA